MNRGIWLFLTLELKFSAHRGEGDLHMEGGGYFHTRRTHQKWETVPCRDCLTHLLDLLKVCAMPVALWVWEDRRSAQIPLVGLTCRHHRRRWLLKENRCAGNSHWCLLILDELSVLTHVEEGSGWVLSWWGLGWRGSLLPVLASPLHHPALEVGDKRLSHPLSKIVSIQEASGLTSLASAQHVAFKR